jgi:flagellar hook assembly protein FlgD
VGGEITETLSVVPNPASGNEFEVNTYNKLKSNLTITLVNVNGQTVYTDTLGAKDPGEFRYTIDASSLPKGIYILNVSSETGVKTAKVIRN